MARKHNLKRNRVSQHVERTLVTPAQTERKVVLNPNTDEYEAITVILKPAVYRQSKVVGGSTLKGRGLPNVGGAKSSPVKGGKK
jgi:hypothetical protein